MGYKTEQIGKTSSSLLLSVTIIIIIIIITIIVIIIIGTTGKHHCNAYLVHNIRMYKYYVPPTQRNVCIVQPGSLPSHPIHTSDNRTRGAEKLLLLVLVCSSSLFVLSVQLVLVIPRLGTHL